MKTKLMKKDVVVILFCVVFLLINLGAIGSGGRRRAKEMVCLSNLRQWGQIWSMYCQDNDGYFCGTGTVGLGRGAWILALRPYLETRTKLLCCPEATRRYPSGVSYGGPFNTYIMGTGGVSNLREECSYGFNCWLYNPQPGQTTIESRPVDRNWKPTDVKGANNIPVFADTMWSGGYPLDTDSSPAYNGEFGSWLAPEMNHFCIDRHNGAVNHLFMDWSVRKVGLKELWTLKWHRQYNTEGPWSKAGGVWPSDWPQWMRGFKDY